MLAIITLCSAACERDEPPVSDELQELLGQVPDQHMPIDDAEAGPDAVVTTDEQADLRPGVRVQPPQEVVERLFIVLRRGMLDQVEALFHLPLSVETRGPLMDALRAQRLMMEAGDLEVIVKDAKASTNHAVVIVDFVNYRDRPRVYHNVERFYMMRVEGSVQLQGLPPLGEHARRAGDRGIRRVRSVAPRAAPGTDRRDTSRGGGGADR